MALALTQQMRRAFSYQPGITFIVGAGGKTSLLFALFHSWRETFSVLMTTTTRMAADQLLPEFAVQDVDTYEKTCEAIAAHIQYGKSVFVYNRIEAGKLYGTSYPVESLVDPGSNGCELYFDLGFVEADGAQNRLIKFPKAH